MELVQYLPPLLILRDPLNPTMWSSKLSHCTRSKYVLGVSIERESDLLPVVLVGLNFAGIVKGRQISKCWRIPVFLVCLFSAVAAPGANATSMFYFAAPLLVLFLPPSAYACSTTNAGNAVPPGSRRRPKPPRTPPTPDSELQNL